MKMRATLATLSAVLATMLGTTVLSPSAHADTSLHTSINSLTVVGESDPGGYDRKLFGTYDRAARLADNFAAWPDCVGYYSEADNVCYTDASEVDVDHMVALKEAWESGASGWTSSKRKAFGDDPLNQWIMTDNLNSSKGNKDFAEWTPPSNAALCDYITAYVATKVKYALAVDTSEKHALSSVADKCEPVSNPSPSPSTDSSSNPSPTPSGAVTLPKTGVNASLLVGIASLLMGLGVATLAVTRRRRN